MPSPLHPDTLRARLDRSLARTTHRRARRGLPAPQALATAPGFEYRYGAQHEPFHAASVGKLATTTLVLQEVAAGHLRLDDEVEAILPAELTAGLFRGRGATLAQLLEHSSGVNDFFEGRIASGPTFFELLRGQPEREWQPQELLAFTREHQHPVGTPGERFLYSDTGFVLLGLVLEAVTSTPYPSLVRTRVLEPAGMDSSVVWLREPGPARIAPLRLGATDLAAARALTLDWASGGIVTTTDDLARLGRALIDGTLLAPGTLAELAEPRHRFTPATGIHYGRGAMRIEYGGFSPFLRALPPTIGHLGVTGVHLFVNPERGTSIVLNFHGTREMLASFRTHIRIARGLAQLAERPGERL